MVKTNSVSRKFCRCVKKVRGTVKLRGRSGFGRRPVQASESAAIGICVRSVLGKRGKTLKKFTCTKRGGPRVMTQLPSQVGED